MTKTSEEYDWALLEDPRVMDVLNRAVGKCAKKTAIDADDIRQEAFLLIATRPNEYREKLDNEAALFRTLYFDLIDKFKTEVSRRSKTVSRDAILEGYEE